MNTPRFHFQQLPPLSLYIHLPWCVKKCPYCDFNSHATEHVPEAAYVQALLEDLENELPLVWGRRVISIFIGGGTPSLFSPQAIETLLSGVRARIPLTSNVEVTMEANPGAIDNQHLAGFREAGVNRLSIGVQSFNSESLQRIGRIHSAEQAFEAFNAARAAGFDNINLDMMFALPEQNLESAEEDVKTALSLSPEHLSYYHLTLEPNTQFYQQPPKLPDDDTAWEIHQQGLDNFQQAGYEHYEVSAFSKPGKACRHNINYWRFGDYLGIGAGAHGKISNAQTGQILRRSKSRHPKDYMSDSDSRLSSTHWLTEKDVTFEFMLNALRLCDGFERELFEAHTGLSWHELERPLERALEKDFIEYLQSSQIVLTIKGKNFLNDVLELFLPGE